MTLKKINKSQEHTSERKTKGSPSGSEEVSIENMSLFVGNISSRVHQTELERTFQRFGRSKLELKDGYGFVVYDTVRDAEKALRALKGRIICGEQLSITWSRKQRPFRRFSGKDFPGRSYGNRDFRKEVHEIKARNSQEREEIANNLNKHANHKEDTEGNGFVFKEGKVDGSKNDMVGEDEKCQNLIEAAFNERCKTDPVPLENDRWGEPLSEASDEHNIAEEATNLQRYDPYSADNRKEEDAYENEKYQKVKSNDSYAANNSERGLKHRERNEAWMGHGGFGKSLERCYICGQMGHVMRQCCSRAVVSRRDKFDRVGQKRTSERNFKGNGLMRFKGAREMEWSRNDLTRDSIPKRKDFIGQRFIRKDRRLHDRTEGFTEKKRKHSRYLCDDRKEAQTRERTGRRHKKHRTTSIPWQAGVRHNSHSSGPHSESQHRTHSTCSTPSSQSSFSRSQSSRSSSLLASSQSHSCSPWSGSKSSRSYPLSSHPRSHSVSSYTKSAKPVSKSRSCSVTPRSLSVSLSPRVRRSPSPSWLDHGLCGLQDATFSTQSLKNNSPSEAQKDLSEQMIHGNDVAEHMEREYLRLAVKVENDLRVRIIQDYEIENPGRCIDNSRNCMYSESTGKRENSSSAEGADTDRVAEDYGTKDGMVRNPELNMAEISVDTSMKACFENVNMAHVKVGDESSIGKGDEKCAANISLEEVNVILHHSRGMSIEDAEHGSSVESNIGAARLWPWEVILYRRLKRGAISTANYSRRMSQNKMFGIVDKYIRSSSGWWENESHEF